MTAATNLPRRLGRYDVVVSLAVEADSSLFVGRLDEPGAAEVAIRRVAPGPLRDKGAEAFVTRVDNVVGIEHPNLATIHEVVHTDDELFVVMEHVQGHSAAALLERLNAEGRTLDYGQAAYIAAEIAAALEEAHDHNVLHEHLTPDRVVIGYDGRVKVLDLGVRSALDALTGVATVRPAELPYASPERCKGDLLDRRSDVFSLGTILWELMMGIAPFARETEADTLRAILHEEEIMPPPHILRTLPVQLSEIATRAVLGDRSKRYPTARALRHELRTFLRGLPKVASLGELVHELFGAPRESMGPSTLPGHEVLASLAKRPSDRPTIEISSASLMPAPLPTIVEARPTETPTSLEVSNDDSAEPPVSRPRFSRKAVVFVALGSIILLMIVGLLLPPSAPATAFKGDARTASSASLAPASGSLGSAEPPATAKAPATDPAQPGQTTVSIETTPPKATIVIGGNVMGTSPIDLKLPKSRELVTVEIRLAGYRTSKEQVVPDVDQRLRLTLNPAPRSGPAPTSGTPYHRFD